MEKSALGETQRTRERKKQGKNTQNVKKIAREIRKQRPSVNLVLCLSTMAI